MFKTHKIWVNTLSIKNLILLFFTIILGFASVITLADITIPSSIDNAWQTIGRVSITSNGNDGSALIDMSSWGIHIDNSILPWLSSFDGKILWLNDAGNMIYVLSKDLIVSWSSSSSTTTGSDEDWSISGNDIYTQQNGNVGIGTQTMSGKLHIVGKWDTEVYIEETDNQKAANINFKNNIRTWTLWGDSYPDIFYIGIPGANQFVSITPLWFVGIWTTGPTAPLQVIGNVIAGAESNQINGINSFIAGGQNNSISWAESFAGGRYAIVEHNNTFIRNNTDSRFTSFKPGTFLINAPFIGGDIPSWWVGINTNNPQTALDVEWLIRTRPNPDLGWCTSETKWAIWFKSTDNHFYGCNGTDRIQLDNVK